MHLAVNNTKTKTKAKGKGKTKQRKHKIIIIIITMIKRKKTNTLCIKSIRAPFMKLHIEKNQSINKMKNEK